MLKTLTDHFQNKKYLALTTAGLILVGLVMTVFSLHKTVTLVVDGEERQVTTFALTRQAFLNQQGLSITEQDRLYPSGQTFLWGDETVIITQAQPISLIHNQQVEQVITAERIPANILSEADLQLYPGDRLMIDGLPAEPHQALSPGPHTIQLIQATPLVVQYGDQINRFSSSAPTLADALSEQEYKIFAGDQVTPALSSPLQGNELQVTIQPSRLIPVEHDQGEVRLVRSAAETVGGVLTDAGIPLQGLDYSIPDETQPAQPDQPIEIVRVTETYILNQEPIEFSNQFQPTNDLVLDQEQILQGGEYGLKAQRIRVISENKTEVSRKVEKEWVVKEPQPRVIGYGTRIEVKTADTADGQIKYWRKIEAYATSYNENCPGCSKWTASGSRLKKGTVAVPRAWYSYMKGMRLYIPGYGFGRVEDMCPGCNGFWVDLGYDLENYEPWSSNVTVYFLTPVPSPELILNPLY